MYFQSIENQAGGLIGYLLCDPRERVAVVVDPPRSGLDVLLAHLGAHHVKLERVLRTHVHADDADVCGGLCARTGAELGIGKTAAGRPASATRVACVQRHVAFGDEVLTVLPTPGHTPDSVSYLWRDRLLCGDLFDFGSLCADDGTCDPAQAFDSLTRRIFVLPESTLVFPAHPMKGRRVATLAELRMRYLPILKRGREAFINEMLRSRCCNSRSMT